MVQPTDYYGQLRQFNPASILDTFQGARQQRVAGEQAAAAYSVQQQQLARQQALQKQQDEALQALVAEGGNTPENFNRYLTLNPDHAEQIVASHQAMDTDARNTDVRQTAAVDGYLRAGQTDQALALVDQRLAADQAAGRDVSHLQQLRQIIQTDPRQAQLVTGAALAALGGADKYAANASVLGENNRANALLPGAIAQQGATLAKTQADTAGQQAQNLRDQFLLVGDGEQVVPIDPRGISPDYFSGGQGGSAAPSAAAPVSIPGPAGQEVIDTATAAGATPEEMAYLGALATIESNGDPSARNGSSTGIFQFQPQTFESVGGGDINNVADQTRAAIQLAQRNSESLAPALGRDPTTAELYLAHQQGAAGAAALLTAPPEVSAIAALEGAGVPPDTARASIVGNGGSPSMTAGQFVQKWADRYNEAAGGVQPGVGISTGPRPGSGLGPVAYEGPGRAAAEAESPLSPEAVAMVGEQYLRLGPAALVNMGQGRTGVQNKNRVIEWAANAAREAGTSNPELVVRFVQNKANIAALGQMQKNLSLIASSEHTLAANADLALRLAQNGGLGPTGVPLLDTPINTLRRQLGSADATALNNAMVTTANEYAKVLTTTTGTGGGATSDSARREAQDLLNSGMTLRQMIAAVNVAKQEAENRRTAIQAEATRLANAIGGVPTQQAPAAAPASPAQRLRFDAQGNLIQ
jgi:hypothetical protein